ncbi:hypothetical protein GpartN1_g7703.t1 [Galdieria partita]|uniref:Uncharacterized protein n=1 Tax=Galdieria partita TaxID=83374 RepID=A0A9C7Q8A5_9RHOD|nr:hypothetical protein GpartN1_g7703.t1 [Galdieria partita]
MEGAQETSFSTCSFIPKELSAEELSESDFITNGLFTENDKDAVSLSSNSKETSGSSSNQSIQNHEIVSYQDKSTEENSKMSSDGEFLGSNEYIFQDLFTGKRALTSEEFAEKILYLTDLITREREEKYKLQKKVRTLAEEKRLQNYDLEELRDELVHCRKEKQNYYRQVEMLQQEKLFFKSRLDEQIEKGSQDSDSHWNLQNEIRDLQMKLQEMEHEVKETSNYAANLKIKLDRKSEEVVQLKAKEQTYHEREETLRKERDALIRSNAEAVQTVEQLRHTWNSVQEQLRMEVSRRKKQESEYRQCVQEMEQKSRKLKEENENFQFALQNLENLLEEKQLACENNQQLIDNYETQIVSFNEELRHLKEIRNSLQQRVIETTEQLQERDDVIERLNTTLENKSRRCKDLEKTTQSLQERQDDLLNKIRVLQEDCQRLKKEKEHLSELRERASAEAESYATQLNSVEEQRRKLEEQIQHLQSLLQRSRVEEEKLRIKCENQKQLLEEYERQLEKNSSLQESAIFQQICDLLDQKLPKLNDSGEQKSVILQLADKVQQLCDEKEEMIAIIDHMKQELDANKKVEEQCGERDFNDLKDLLEQKEREISHLEARLQQTSEEKTFAENELRLLQKEIEQIRGYNSLNFDKSELSSGKLSSSFSEQSLQKVLKAFDNLVHEKKILSHKNKELNERLRVTLESRELDEETTRSLLKESQTIQQQLCGIISAHESVLNEMKDEPVSPYPLVYKDVEEDKENKDMNSSIVSTCDEPLIRAMNTHIFQLRNMWLHELENNAELRSIIVELHQKKKAGENVCHRGVQCFESGMKNAQVIGLDDDSSGKWMETIDDLKNRNSCLVQNLEEYKMKLEESSNLLVDLRSTWHSWVTRLYELLPFKEAVEDENNVERICLQIFNYLKFTVRKFHSFSVEIENLEKENERINDCVMNLKTQKSLFLYTLEKNNNVACLQVTTYFSQPKERLKTYLVTLLGMWRLCSLLDSEKSGVEAPCKNWYYLQAPQCAKSFDNKKEMENVMNTALVPRLQSEIAQKNKVIHQLERRIAALQEKRRPEHGENDSSEIPYKSLRMMLEEKDAKLKQGQLNIDRLKAQREKLQLQITNISKELETLAASESRERFAKESAESRIQLMNKKLQTEMKKVEALKKEIYEREKKFQDTIAQLLAKTEESFSSEYGSTGGLRQSPRFSPSFNSPPVKESSSMKKKKSPKSGSQKDEEATRKLQGSSLISQFHQVSDSKTSQGGKNSPSTHKSLVDHILSSAEASLAKAKKDESTEESVQELREHIQELRNASMKLMSKSTV